MLTVVEAVVGTAVTTVQNSGDVDFSASRGASGLIESKLIKAFARATTDAATTRNWTTVATLHAAADDERDGG